MAPLTCGGGAGVGSGGYREADERPRRAAVGSAPAFPGPDRGPALAAPATGHVYIGRPSRSRPRPKPQDIRRYTYTTTVNGTHHMSCSEQNNHEAHLAA
jgi:hypothetical protein